MSLDPQLGALQALDAGRIELLAASEQADRLVDGNVAALEPRHDLLQLPLQLLERPVGAHGRISSTRASTEPDASWMSSASPVLNAAASRTVSAPERTMA